MHLKFMEVIAVPNRNLQKSYLELTTFSTFKERLEYLKIGGTVGKETFGRDRYLNQILYKTQIWLNFRETVIMRDEGCDLGVKGYEIINDKILVHHINPITLEDVLNLSPMVFDLNNVISTRLSTHNAIHYGTDLTTIITEERRENDTCPWKKSKGGIYVDQ